MQKASRPAEVVKELEKANAKIKRMSTAHEGTKKSYMRYREEALSHIADLQSQLDEREDQVADLSIDIGDKSVELEDLQAKLKRAKADRDIEAKCADERLTEIVSLQSKLSEAEEKVSDVWNDNIRLSKCVEDVLVQLANYDGYENDIEGLKRLIDFTVKLLSKGYPIRLYNEIRGEICPICDQSITPPERTDNETV
jgi:chromosome segregation ATPase